MAKGEEPNILFIGVKPRFQKTTWLTVIKGRDPYSATANTGMMIRTTTLPAGFSAAGRAEIRASDSGLAVFDLRTMEDLRQSNFWQFRLFGVMFGIFSAAAVFLAGIGVYGVLSFSAPL